MLLTFNQISDVGLLLITHDSKLLLQTPKY